jgi:hypothetical protein
VDVTPLRFTDFSPAFTEDGRYLAFLSVRSFDPVYDAYVFDLSFPTGCRPYLVTLAATTPSPFDPYRLGRPIGDDDPSDKAKDGDDENPRRQDQPRLGDGEACERGRGPAATTVGRLHQRSPCERSSGGPVTRQLLAHRLAGGRALERRRPALASASTARSRAL